MCFGGPSQGEEAAAAAQTSLTNNLNQYFNENMQNQQGVISKLNSSLSAMATAPQGFTPAQTAALNTAAINNSAAANKNAAQTVGAELAGRGGGGSSGLESGIDQQIKGSIASSSANQLAGAENQIVQQNALLQQQNQKFGLSGLQALAGLEGQTGTELGGLTQKGNAADFSNQDTLNQQEIAKQQSILGTVAGAAIDLGTFGAGGIGALGSGESFGEGVGDFFKGGANALAGNNLFNVNPGSAPSTTSNNQFG